jgi:hypothetical protein
MLVSLDLECVCGPCGPCGPCGSFTSLVVGTLECWYVSMLVGFIGIW